MHTALARLVILLTGLHWTTSDWYSRNMQELHSLDAQRYSEVGAFFRLPYRSISLSLGHDRSTRNWTCITPILVGSPYRHYWVRETWDWQTSSRPKRWYSLWGNMPPLAGNKDDKVPLLDLEILPVFRHRWLWLYSTQISHTEHAKYHGLQRRVSHILSRISEVLQILVHYLRAPSTSCLDLHNLNLFEALARLNLIRRNFVISTPSKIETLGATIQSLTVSVARTYEDGSFRRFPRLAHWCFGRSGSGPRRADTLAWHFPCSCQIATL